MFSLGTNDYGAPQCNQRVSGCSCFCEEYKSMFGQCMLQKDDGFRLYSYADPGPDYQIDGIDSSCVKSLTHNCTEWSGVSFDLCKRKCTQNDVLSYMCPKQNCSYFQFNGTTGHCRLIYDVPKRCKRKTDMITLRKTAPAFHLYADKSECLGSEIYKGYVQGAKECAAKCHDHSPMFLMGTNDWRRGTCKPASDGKGVSCRCYCETEAKEVGLCNRKYLSGYRLYHIPGFHTKSDNICPKFWIHFNKKCYLFVEDSNKSWKEAKESCLLKGGHLLTVEDESEHNSLVDIIDTMNYMNKRNRSYWIGLSNQDEGKDWMWIDSTINYQSQKFKFWSNKKPSNMTNRCALYHFKAGGKQVLETWFDLPCESTPSCGKYGCIGHICKRNAPEHAECKCTGGYKLRNGVEVEAYCLDWSGRGWGPFCYLKGGSKAANCPGARRSRYGPYYYTRNVGVCINSVGRSQKGNRTYRYFVKKDDVVRGGRYLECSLLTDPDKDTSSVRVRTHNGETKTYKSSSIFKIGCPPKIGDAVIAYWVLDSNAYKGTVKEQRNSRYYIHFDDGDKKWVNEDQVYKMVNIASDSCKAIAATHRAPGKIGEECWGPCGQKGGDCPGFCGANATCCRRGWANDPAECEGSGCDGNHCCTKKDCGPPNQQDIIRIGKDCPRNRSSECLNKNREYSTLAGAWQMCKKVADCGFVMRYHDGKFLLRRQTDPDRVRYNIWGYKFTCAHKESGKIGEECWRPCGEKGGNCPEFCGVSAACCRRGYANDPAECNGGGCEGNHCCTQKVCPSSHPFAYLNGEYCCANGYENFNQREGALCDGSVISNTSVCCRDGRYVKCPSGRCATRKPESVCPPSHPFPYLNGIHCCNSGYENIHESEGAMCDGSVIAYTSRCCKTSNVKCPSGRCVMQKQAPECKCSDKYNVSSIKGGMVPAYCGRWSKSNFDWCYLEGGLEASSCPGAVRSSSGKFYWSRHLNICAKKNCLDGDVLLSSDNSPMIYKNGLFHPICGHWFWDNNEGARLFCEKLGYKSGQLDNLGKVQNYTKNSIWVGVCNNGSNGISNCAGPCNTFKVGGRCRDSSCDAGEPVKISITCKGTGKKDSCSVSPTQIQFQQLRNLALGKPTVQSSTSYGGVSSRAVDGDRTTSWHGQSCTHTSRGSRWSSYHSLFSRYRSFLRWRMPRLFLGMSRVSQSSYWRVDLEEKSIVKKVIIYNRQDCCSSRLNGFELSVSDSPSGFSSTKCSGPSDVSGIEKIEVFCPHDAVGRYVRVTKKGSVPLTLCEVEVLGINAKGMCPSSHPYAYHDGLYCCKHGKEKHSSNPTDGNKCDGSTISITSRCCLDDSNIRCPHGLCRSSAYTYGPPILKSTNVHRCGPKFKADCPNEGNYACCNLEEGKCGGSSAYCKCRNCIDFRKHDDLKNMRSTVVTYTKIAANMSCDEKHIAKGYKKTVAECSLACYGSGTMFVYGKAGKRCSSQGCTCSCVKDLSLQGRCSKHFNHKSVDTYLINGAHMYKNYGNGMTCKNYHALYTKPMGLSSQCDGWSGISLKECQDKCSRNEVPNARCPRQNVSCTYVRYNQYDKWCHLGDERCEPVKGRNRFILVKKEEDYKFGPPIKRGYNEGRCGSLFRADCPDNGKSCCNLETGKCSSLVCNCENCVDFRKDLNKMAALTNFAYGKPAFQSSLYHDRGPAGKAVDGHVSGNYMDHSCTHTVSETSPWWMVDMLQEVTVREVIIYNREDCCSRRLQGFKVYIGNDKNRITNTYCEGDLEVSNNHRIEVVCKRPVRGRYVVVTIPGANRTLTLCEVQALGHADVAYDYIGNGMVCNVPETNNSCHSWEEISEEDCRIRCSNNYISSNTCNTRECKYYMYDRKNGICHLKDQNCKPEPDSTLVSRRTHTFRKFVPDYELFLGIGKCGERNPVYQGMTHSVERCAEHCRQTKYSYFTYDGCEFITTAHMPRRGKMCNCNCYTDILECNQTSSLNSSTLYKFFDTKKVTPEIKVPKFHHAKEKSCARADVVMGLLPSVQHCAKVCVGISSMFIYGIQPKRCYEKDGKLLCMCYCELSAFKNATCDTIEMPFYNLYAFNLTAIDAVEPMVPDVNEGTLLRKGEVLLNSTQRTSWLLSIDIKPFASVPTQSMILRVSEPIATDDQYGNSLPAIYFESESTKLRICNDMNGTASVCFTTKPIPMNTFTKVLVSQTLIKGDDYLFAIYIDNSLVYAITNVDARNWREVVVRTDPLWSPANAYVRSFVYKKSMEVYTPSGTRCYFPFLYNGVVYTDCIQEADYSWCSLTPNHDKDGEWGKCTDKVMDTLVADHKRCNSTKSDVSLQLSHTQCGKHCLGHAPMFSFGIHGREACNASGCLCMCHIDAHMAGVCNEIDDVTMNLYSYAELKTKYLGCWQDDKRNHAIPSMEVVCPLLEGGYWNREDSFWQCYHCAKFRGCNIFALQDGGRCSGSDKEGDFYKKYGSANTCRPDGSGGVLANSVYEVLDNEDKSLGSRPQNVAYGKPATQSSTSFFDPPGQAMLAVDGQVNGDYYAGSCTMTESDSPAWWWLDLLDSYEILQVVIFNRADCCSEFLSNAVIKIGNDPTGANNQRCGNDIGDTKGIKKIVTNCSSSTVGRFVEISLPGSQVLSLCEVQVMGFPYVAAKKEVKEEYHAVENKVMTPTSAPSKKENEIQKSGNDSLSSAGTVAVVILGITVVVAVVIGVLVRRRGTNVIFKFHQPKDEPLFELDENLEDESSLQNELL